MEMESKVFRRRRPVPAELEKYGFSKTPEGWVYETDLLAGAFRAQVTVGQQEDGSVQGDVIDAETGALYMDQKGPGSYEFGWMTFDQEHVGNTYVYTVREMPGSDSRYDYDE